jgi:hypothetical protein
MSSASARTSREAADYNLPGAWYRAEPRRKLPTRRSIEQAGGPIVKPASGPTIAEPVSCPTIEPTSGPSVKPASWPSIEEPSKELEKLEESVEER